MPISPRPTASSFVTGPLTKLYNARPAWLAAAHDELDAAVAAACGFPANLPASEILLRLLNRVM